MKRALLFSTWAAIAAAMATGRFVRVAAAPNGPPPFAIDALMDIRHPSDARWSPDGRQVAFLWERTGDQDVWVADVGGDRSPQPRPLTQHQGGLVQALFWGNGGHTLYFARGGDLWQVPADGSRPASAVWTTPDAETGITLSPDGATFAFSRRGDLFIRSLADGREQQLTGTPANESNPIWSPDGARIAFTVSTPPTRRAQPFDYFGSKIQFTWNERTGTPHVAVVSVADGRVVSTGTTTGFEGDVRWVDPTHLSLQRVDQAYKVRQVVLVDATTGESKSLYRDVEDTWFNLTYNEAAPEPSPDGRWIALLTDRDGWDQVSVIGTADGRIRQLTTGKSDASRIAWSHDSHRIVFDRDDEGAPGRKHLAFVDVTEPAGKPAPIVLTHGRGTNTSAEWSPSGDRVLYQHTDPKNSADLFVLRIPSGGRVGEPVRLTDSMPASIDRRALVEPQSVSYPSTDGRPVPAKLFVPPGLDRSTRHPAIVWIHGDTVNQNYDGWHVQRNYAIYYSFHEYLLQKGYVVLAPDFRGSIGYGKSWRQAVYGDFGGQQYRDVAAGVDYLGTLGFVDTQRVAVWGLSGGGFLTLEAVTTTPTLFRCAVDIAGVTDFGDHLRDPAPPFLEARLRPKSENPQQYDQAAPIRRVDRIAIPLLVLAGTADTNVPFEQSARLVDTLLKNHKNFEFMMYPGEFHYFRREHVLRDAWRRIERFFDDHLRDGTKGPAPAPAAFEKERP